ncbi:MAG: SRPBCC family protein [Gemmatimonadales bacterium]
MIDIRTTTDIHAPPDAIWQALTDLPKYPEWNPYITRANGAVEVGERLELRVELPGGGARTLRPLVIEAESNRQLTWVEEGWLPGMLDGHHSFTIVPRGQDRTHVVHRATFTGLLLPFLRARLETNVREGFEAMNRALKARAQGGGGPGL